jgi:hypothetical protein
MLTREQLPPLQGSPIDYDKTVRLLGYRAATPYIHAHQINTMTLCWEVLAPTFNEAVLALKVLDNGNYVADRTMIPGLGHYNSWQWKRGDIFCDDVDIPVKTDLKLGYTYDVEAVMIGWKATTTTGTPLDLPHIAEVISPVGDMSAQAQGDAWKPSTIEVPHFANLAKMSVEGTVVPGQTIKVSLLWQVNQHTPINWSQFFHLVGPDNYTAVIEDKIPNQGAYPTWAWLPGEKFLDSWQLPLPADLKPGSYQIETGFYRQDNGERAPIASDGKQSPTGAVNLLTFEVKQN